MCRSETSVLTQTRDTQSFSGLSSTSSSRSSPQCAISITKKEQWRLLEQRRVLVKKVADANHAVDNGEFTFRQQGFPPPAAQAGVPILATSYSGGPWTAYRRVEGPRSVSVLCASYTHGRSCFLKSSVSSSFTLVPCKQFHPVLMEGLRFPFSSAASSMSSSRSTSVVCAGFPRVSRRNFWRIWLSSTSKSSASSSFFVQESSKFHAVVSRGLPQRVFPWSSLLDLENLLIFLQFSRDGRVGSKPAICHTARHTRHTTHDTRHTDTRHTTRHTRHDTHDTHTTHHTWYAHTHTRSTHTWHTHDTHHTHNKQRTHINAHDFSKQKGAREGRDAILARNCPTYLMCLTDLARSLTGAMNDPWPAMTHLTNFH